MLLSLYDWNDELIITDLIHSLPESIVRHMTSADAVLAVNGKRRSKPASMKAILSAVESETIEVQVSEPSGGTLNDVFCYIHRKGRKTLIVRGDNSMFSWDSCLAYLERVALHGNLGYGYADSQLIDQQALYFALGMNLGQPVTQEERDRAGTISRWFNERIPMKDIPAMNRHLAGFFRDVFEVNIITDRHLGQLCEDGSTLQEKIVREKGRLGYIECLANLSYVWVLPMDTRKRARELLESMKVII